MKDEECLFCNCLNIGLRVLCLVFATFSFAV